MKYPEIKINAPVFNTKRILFVNTVSFKCEAFPSSMFRRESRIALEFGSFIVL